MSGAPAEVPAPAAVGTLPLRDGSLEYASCGEGPAVLALHGAMGGWDQSLLLARTIAESGYRFLAVSRPGYLGTPLALGREPEAQADACASLLDHLGVASAAVLAVSGGGPCALHFALRHRERCRGLVLVSTCAGPVEGPSPLRFLMLRLTLHVPGFAARTRRSVQRDLEAALTRSIPDPALRARVLGDAHVRELARALLRSTFERPLERLAGTANDIRVTRVREYPLERVAVPVLVVHGTADDMLPIARHGAALARRIPGAELLAAQGGGHMSIYTHHAEIQPRVTRFLRDITPGRG